MHGRQIIAASAAQFEREVADFGRAQHARYLWSHYCAIVRSTTKAPSTLDVVNSLYRYPSPNRPAYSPSGPITVSCRNSARKKYDIGYHSELGFGANSGRINCDAPSETTIGLRLCKRHQSSLQQWQYSVWLVALRTTWSAALSALELALRPRRSLERTEPVRLPLVQLQVFCAITQASRAAKNLDTRAHRGRTINKNRRRGFALAAVLRFGD